VISKNIAPTRLQGTQGLKNTLYSKELRASCVKLIDIYLSIVLKSLSDLIYLFLNSITNPEIIIGAASFGGGVLCDINIKIVINPVTYFSSKSLKIQDLIKILNAMDEFGRT